MSGSVRYAAHRLALVPLCALAGWLALPSTPALAAAKYVPSSSFGSGGALQAPVGLGVEQASGEVFMADQGSVQRFVPVNRAAPSAGYSLGAPLSGSFTFAFGVGVDDSGGLSQGDVYVADEPAHVVDKFDATGLPDATTPQIGAEAKPLALSTPCDAAVDPANGDVYVSDYSNNVVDIFTPTGEFISQFATGSGPIGLAFNSTGSALYVAATNTGKVEEYDSAGTPVEQTAGSNAGTNIVDGSGHAVAVAVDTSTNDVYVDEPPSVAVYESSGAPLDGIGFHTGISFSLGIAVDSLTHTVFVGDFNGSAVDVFGQVLLPTVSTGQATAVTETGATLEGTVNPEGQPVTSCEFQYGTSTSYGQSVACLPAGIGSGSEPVPVAAGIKGLQGNVTYHYRLVSSNANGTENGADQTLTTSSPPIVDGESFSEVGAKQATLNAHVNAAGSPSTYQFQYGPSTSYGSVTPQAGFGSAQGDVSLSATVSGLQPDTVYHFRVLATNVHGTTPGADTTLTTFPPATSTLPDGRVYEIVTPVENVNANAMVPEGPESGNQQDGIGTFFPFQAAADGSAVAYLAEPTAGGNGRDALSGGNENLATRAAAGGWTQRNIQPTGLTSPIYQAFSDDLSVGILGSAEPLAASAPSGGYNVLYTHVLSENSYRPLFTTAPPSLSPAEFGAFGVTQYSGANIAPVYAGGSSDFSHLLFEANGALTPEAVDGGEQKNNLYDSVGGLQHLVNVLPNGTPEPNASFGSPPPNEGAGNHPPDFSNTISADGSRIFWTDLNTGNLYVRENGDRPQSPLDAQGRCTQAADACTVQVDAAVGGGGLFWAATADGSKVFFTKGDLYEYDVATGHTSDLAPGGEVQGVVGASDDGSYVYFVADGVLASGAKSQSCVNAAGSKCNLYVWHEGETKLIAVLSYADNELGGETGAGLHGDWRLGLGHRTAEVTPDGHSIVFMSTENLTGYPNEGLPEVYVYDATAPGSLFCASCNPSGEPPSATAEQANELVAAYLPYSNSNSYLPRWISQDGSRVFFDALQSLVPQDTNGKQDVYEWERPKQRPEEPGGCEQSKGCIYLLSSGTSGNNSSLLDASVSGNDVFIVTRAQLVPEDRNENFDVYDARVGGVPPAPPSGCQSAVCQGSRPAPSLFATPVSATFSGAGNLVAPAVQPKSKVTRAQKLSAALRVCRRKRQKRKRAACAVQARKRFGAMSRKRQRPAKGRGR